jgi:hypothetical protein
MIQPPISKMMVTENKSNWDIDEISLLEELTDAKNCNCFSEGYSGHETYRYGELPDCDSISYPQSMPAAESQRMNSQDNHKVMPPRRPMTSYNIYSFYWNVNV